MVAPRRAVARLIPPAAKPTPAAMTPQPAKPATHVDVLASASPATTKTRLPSSGKTRAGRAAAARRRRVLILLVALTVLVGAVAGFGLIPGWAVALPLLLIIGFLVAARRSVRRWVRRNSEAYEDQPVEPAPQVSNVARRPPTRVDASHGATRRADPPQHIETDEQTVSLLVGDGSPSASVGALDPGSAAVQTADGGSLWDPLPVTLPMYVDKPLAQRTIRTIDLGDPKTWSSGHVETPSTSATEAERQTGEGTDTSIDKAAGSAEPRRVVNG